MLKSPSLRKIAARAVSALFVSTLAAQSAPQSIPSSPYRIDGKPVPSSCLESLGNGDRSRFDPIDLSHCGDPTMKPKTLPSGLTGYDEPQGAYFYYRDLGQADGLDILYLEHSGGGSGHFTDLVGIKHEGHTIRLIQEYAAGDRCNGGISNVSFANDHLSFDQDITPYDLIVLADPKTKLEAYKDLEASAGSCVASVHAVGDDKHWTGVALTEKSLMDQSGWTENYRYQSCFNSIYRKTVAQGDTELDKKAVMAFADNFSRRCVQGKP